MIHYDCYWVDSEGNRSLLHVAGTTDGITAVENPHLKREVNAGSEFSFTIYSTHPAYDFIQPFDGTVDVYESVNRNDRKRIFHGKITRVKINHKKAKDVTAVGGLSWLKFSQFSQYMNRYTANRTLFPVNKFAKDASVFDMVSTVIKMHNWQMLSNTVNNTGEYDENLQGSMKLVRCDAHQNPYGIDVKNTDDTQNEGIYITRQTTNLSTTYDWFQNELIEKCDASVVVDEDIGGITVYSEYPPICYDQEIREGINIVKCSRDIDFSEMCTVFFPYGKSVRTSVGSGAIRSTNNTSLYVNLVLDSDGAANMDGSKMYTAKNNDSDDSVALDPENDIDSNDNLTNDAIKETKNGETVQVATNDEYPGGITFLLDSPFIIWKEGVEKYGYIVGAKQWSNATRIQLRAYAPAHFKKMILNSETVEVRAIDMGLIDKSIPNSIQLGLRYRVVSPIHGIDEYIQCKSIEISLDKPSNTIYAFERKRKLFTSEIGSMKRILRTLGQNGSQTNQIGIDVGDPGRIYIMNDGGLGLTPQEYISIK